MKPDIGHLVETDRGIGKITRISGRTVTVSGPGWLEFWSIETIEPRWDRIRNLFDMKGVWT